MPDEKPEAAGEVSAIEAAAQALEESAMQDEPAGAAGTAEAGAEQQAEAGDEQAEEAEAGEADEQAEKPAQLPHGVQRRIDKLTEKNRTAAEEIERLKAENAKLAQGAAEREEAQLIEQSKEISAGLNWMRGNKAGFVAELQKRHPYLSEEQAAQMYADRRDELIAQATEMNAKLMQRVMGRKSEGTKQVTTTTTTRPAAALQQKVKPKPTSIVPGGATGGGSGVRAGAKQSVGDILKAKGGTEDRFAVDAAMAAFTGGMATG